MLDRSSLAFFNLDRLKVDPKVVFIVGLGEHVTVINNAVPSIHIDAAPNRKVCRLIVLLLG